MTVGKGKRSWEKLRWKSVQPWMKRNRFNREWSMTGHDMDMAHVVPGPIRA